MVYDGYFTFGGTELINAERTKAYLRHAMPTFGITDACCPCEDLHLVDGEDPNGYSSPGADPAPWWNPHAPASEGFYGLVPLSVEGIDDGTSTVSVTELTSDGAVLSRPRRTSRQVRFTGLLVGAHSEALDAGMAWLKSVLDGGECVDDCGGNDLCYLAACPTVCTYDDYPTTVVDYPLGGVPVEEWTAEAGSQLTDVLARTWQVDTVTTRTNVCTNPSFEVNTTGWNAGNATLSTSTAWASTGTRSLLITPSVAGNPDSFAWFGTAGSLNGFVAGQTYTVSGTVRLDGTQSGTPYATARRITVYHRIGAGAFTAVSSNAAGNWPGATRVSVTFTLPAGTTEVLVRLYNGAELGAGLVWWDSVLIERTSTLGSYFDGSLPDLSSQEVTIVNSWTGTAHASTSTRQVTEYRQVSTPAMPVSVTSSSTSASMSMRLVGLVPGGVYRVIVQASSYQVAPITFSVPGSTPQDYTMWPSVVEADYYYGPMQVPPDGGMGVFEFTASSSVQRLVVTAGVPGDVVTVRRVLVERVAAPSLALVNQPVSGDTSEADAWTWGSTGAGMSTVRGAYGRAVVHSLNTSPGAVTVPAGSPWLQRTITGLVPGRRYTITAGVITNAASPGITPIYYDRGVRMWLTDTGDTTNDPVVWGFGPSSSGDVLGWVQLTFTARSRSHTVRVAPDTAQAVNAGGHAQVEVAYLRVEDDLVGVPISDPDAAGSLRRRLRDVGLVSGPTVTQVFAPQVGAMRQVEFTLVAGEPRPLGDARAVATVLGPGVSVVPQIECSAGAPVLTNHLTQGSFELAPLTPWGTIVSGSGLAATFASVADPDPVAGSRVGRFTVTGSGTGTLRLFTNDVPSVQAATYTASIWVRSTHTATVEWGVLFPSFLTLQGPVDQRTVYGGDGWTRLSITYTVPYGLSSPELYLKAERNSPWPVGAQVDVDGAMVVDGAQLGPYFDGSTPYGVWDGVPFNSTSRYVLTGSDLIVDPDCPPIPAPPRPPVIVNDCIATPTSWRRYTATIPAQVTSVSPWSLPVISVTSGPVAVRGVRVRIVPNPLDLPADQLDPCVYCGEFIVTYLPADTTLVIDTAVRTATMGVGEAAPVSAMHLLYGSDGAPVQWPELTCGNQYTALIDVDVDTAGALVGLDLSVVPAY